MVSPIPVNEVKRLAALKNFGVLDTLPEPQFDRLAALACRVLDMDFAAITLIDEKRMWVKASSSLEAPREMDRAQAFCAHAIASEDDFFEIVDATQDARFADNAVVINAPFVRFYAGAPLRTEDGYALGTLCVLDGKARQLSPSQKQTLRELADMAMHELQTRRQAQVLDGQSGQRSAELAIFHSPKTFQTLIEHGHDIITILESDGIVAYKSPAVKRFLGYLPEELIGTQISDWIHPADLQNHFDPRSLQDWREGQTMATVLRFRHKNGGWRYLESVGHVVADPQKGAGRVNPKLSMVVNSRDVTARIEAQAALHDGRERFKNVFALSPTGMALLAPDGRYWQVNAAWREMTGFSSEEAENQIARQTLSARKLTHADDWEQVSTQVERLLQGEVAVVNFENRLRHRSGRWVWVANSLSLARDNEGAPSYFICQVRDISARRISEQFRAISHQLSQIFAVHLDAETAAPQVLADVMASLGWSVGALWQVESARCAMANILDRQSRQQTDLVTQYECRLEELPGHEQAMRCIGVCEQQATPHFAAYCRGMLIHKGRGLLGRAWQEATLQLIPDVASQTDFRRAQVVRRDGLRDALIVPLLADNRLMGVMEFYDARIEKPDAQQCEELMALGAQIGQFMHHCAIEGAARAVEMRTSAIIEAALDAVVTVNGQGLIVDWNPAASRIFGYTREQVLGQCLTNVITGGQTRAKLCACIDCPVARGGPRTFPGALTTKLVPLDELYEITLMRADGSELVAEMFSTRHNVDGSELVTNFIHDVTHRHRAAQALEESQQRYKSLITHNTDAIASFDCQGRYLEFNPAVEKLFGYRPEELLNLPFGRLLVGKDRKRARRAFHDAGNGQTRTLDIGVMHKNGQRIETMTTLVPIIVDEGVVGIYGIARDVTLLRRNEALIRAAKNEAEAANRAKSEFLSRMSHELRTPLNAILGFGQLLEMSALPKREQEGVTQIMRGGRHLLGLIDEVLDIARIETGRLVLSLESLSAGEMLRETAALVAPLAQRRRIELQEELVENNFACWILADRQRLRQVLLNVFSNAVKYNHEAGWVRFGLEYGSNGRVQIRISDGGPGIAPEQMQRLFSPFERLGAERSQIEGTGLGLAVAKRLVEAMGGAIEAHSAPGEGTAFTITLPQSAPLISPRSPAGVPTTGSTEAPKTAAQTHRVLYIEDNLSNQILIEHLVKGMNDVELQMTASGIEGLHLALEGNFDLVLLDLDLPDLPGAQVLQQLQAHHSANALAMMPVAIVSADATPAQIERLYAQGAQWYFTKPLDLARLRNWIRATLEAK